MNATPIVMCVVLLGPVLAGPVQGADLDAALMNAAERGDLQATDRLLAQGANVNTTNMYAGTPLIAALRSGHIDVARVLLSHKADVAYRPWAGEEAIHCAARLGDASLLATILAAGGNAAAVTPQGETTLTLVISSGNLDAVKLLVEHGADVNYQKKTLKQNGNTALAQAAAAGQLAIAEYLISKGARIDAHDGMGNTPLTLAAYNDHADMVELLLAHGADLQARNNYGWTPLMMGVQNCHTEMTRLLIAKGARVNDRTGDGWTVLSLAAGHSCDDEARLLVASGAKIQEAIACFEDSDAEVNREGVRLLQRLAASH